MRLISQQLLLEADLSSAPPEPSISGVSAELVCFSSESPLSQTGTTGHVLLLGCLAGRHHLALTPGEGEVAGVAPVRVRLCGTPVCPRIVGVVAVSEGIP